jgi:hypothetical protein
VARAHGSLLVLACCGRVGFEGRLGAGDAAVDTAPDAPGAVALVQSAGVFTMSAPEITLVLEPTRPHSTIVVATNNFNIGGVAPAIAAITDSAGDAFESTNARAPWQSGQAIAQIWYSRDGVGGATSLAVASAAATSREVWVLELANLDRAAPLDKIASVSDAAASSLPAAPPAAATAARGVAVSIVFVANQCTGVAAGDVFTGLPILHADDAAYLISSAAGAYGATFVQPNPGVYSAVTATFR